MKGVVLCGGSGSRLLPLTKVTNKHCLPVGKLPMIYHSIQKLVGAGIEKICVVTGYEHVGVFATLLGDGSELNCDLTYRVQMKAGGIAQALGLAKGFINPDEKMCVILGDNMFEDSLAPFARDYALQKSGAMVLLKEVEDPERFGVAEISGDIITHIEEKPKAPKSNKAVTGIYFYDYSVFRIIAGLRPSGRGEMEISDVNNAYLADGGLTFKTFEGWWTDAGTHESYAYANELMGKAKGITL